LEDRAHHNADFVFTNGNTTITNDSKKTAMSEELIPFEVEVPIAEENVQEASFYIRVSTKFFRFNTSRRCFGL